MTLKPKKKSQMKREKKKEKHFEITENKNKPSVDNCNLKLITQNSTN